jgi:hypothetical protein
MGNCLILVMAVSAVIYGFYRTTLKKVSEMVGISRS